MFYASIIFFMSLTGAEQECDRRATIAGQLMILHQTGATQQAVSAAAFATDMPAFASSLVGRVVSAETSPDGSAREMAAYHFAAAIHAECVAGHRIS